MRFGIASGSGVEALGDLPGERDRRIERAFDHLDVELGGVDAGQRADDRGMLDQRDVDRLGERLRQGLFDRLDRREIVRLVADRLAVIGDRGLQRRLRGERGRLGACEARLRLGDVGPGDLADRELVARLPQLLLEHLDIVAVEIENRGVAQHVHVIGDGVEQDILFRVAQGLARAHHARLGLADRIERAIAVPQRLVDRQAVAARLGEDRELAARERRQRTAVLFDRRIPFRRHGRAIARGRLGNVLVARPHRGALLIDVRVVEIGLDQRAADRLRRRPAPAGQRRDRRHQGESAHADHPARRARRHRTDPR